METPKISFLDRVRKAILKFEDYEQFVKEPIQKAFGYFFKLMIIVALLITIVITYKMTQQTKMIVSTIDKEFPQFEIVNSELKVDSDDSFSYYFEDFNLNVVMDSMTTENSKQDQDTFAFLKDKIVFNLNGFMQTVSYKDLQIDNFSKNNLIDYYKTNNWIVEIVITALLVFIVAYILISIIILANVLMLFLIGSILNIIIRIELSNKDIGKISIYSMTLPIFLYLIYIISNILWGVTIRYFDIAYKSISYIYLVTVLLMMKSEAIKNKQELMKIMEVQKEVKKELDRERQEGREEQERKKKEEEQEKEKKRKKEKEEPDGEPQT